MEIASLIILGFAAVSAIVAGSIKAATVIITDQFINKDKIVASIVFTLIAGVILMDVPQGIVNKMFWLVMAAAFIMSQVALYKAITGLFAARHEIRETHVVVRTIHVNEPNVGHNCVATGNCLYDME